MLDENVLQEFETSASSGIDAGLKFLGQQFLKSGNYHRLFDVRKMEVRRGLGLSLLHSDDDPQLDEASQVKLENGLLDSCREIARLYLEQGNLEEGWAYLQPLGDEPLARELIETVEVTEDNFGSVIEVAFNNGVSPVYGYRLMLQRSGTCNGITAFDIHAPQFDRETVSALAAALLEHFYNELRANVIEHVRNVEGQGSADDSDSASGTDSLNELLQKHEWLVREGGHHADATHLASVVRIARQTTTRQDHEKALALANYGCRLGADFQFSSEPPFENLYEDHCVWFKALLGTDLEAGLDHFENKADAAKGQHYENSAAEALVDLQIRTGNRDAAVESAIARLLSQTEPENLPPAAFEIAKTHRQFEKLAESFKTRANFAGYAFAVLCREESGDRPG